MSSMKFSFLNVEGDDFYQQITINRPQVLNALSYGVLAEMHQALDQLSPSCRAVVLRGAGDKAFVAGADIAEMNDLGADQAQAFAKLGQDLTRRLEDLPAITIAVIQGFALGGGCELAMACDLIIAGEKARFGQPEVNLGLVPGFGGTQRLVRRTGLAVALDVLCAGRMLSGREAKECGLISRLCPQEQIEDELQSVLNGIRKAGPEANALCKRLSRNSEFWPIDSGLIEERHAFGKLFGSDETKEGLSAFLQKRPASFSK